MKKFLFAVSFIIFGSLFYIQLANAAPTIVYHLDRGYNEIYDRVGYDDSLCDLSIYWDADIAASSYGGTGSDRIYWAKFMTGDARNYSNSNGVYRGFITLVDSYNNKSYLYDQYYCTNMATDKAIYPGKYVGWSSNKNPYFAQDIAVFAACPDRTSCGFTYNAILTQ